MEVNVGAWNATETMRNFDDFRISRCGAPLTRARAHARCLEFNQRRNPTAALPPRYRLCEGTKLLSWQFPPEEEKKEREREREREGGRRLPSGPSHGAPVLAGGRRAASAALVEEALSWSDASLTSTRRDNSRPRANSFFQRT
jgi:hypothetical protein